MVVGGLFLAAETTQWWHLYLAFGVITAAGIGLSGYVPCVILVREWFPTRTGTVVGIAAAGIGVGIAMLFPLSQFMIDRIGWRWAFRVLGGLVITWMVPATTWFLRRVPHSRQPGPSKERPDSREPWGQTTHWTLPKALWSWRFWGLVGVLFAHNGAIQILMTHQVAYLVDHGAPAIVAASVGGIVGLTSVAAKMGWGYLLDRILREVVFTITSTCFILGAGVLVLAGVYPATILPYAYAVLIGLGHSVIAPITPAAAGDLFGGPGFSTIFGAVQVSLGFGSAIGAWGAGEIFDRTGSYALALWAAVVLTVFSCALLWVVAPRRPNPPRPIT
jgi:MFS family permease